MSKSSKSKVRKQPSSGSEDSDSGPDDVNPPPSKKIKPSASNKQADGSIKFELSNNKYVTVREFKGKVFVDIREFYMDSKGEEKPGKKGIALSGEQWGKLKGLTKDIDEALKKF